MNIKDIIEGLNKNPDEKFLIDEVKGMVADKVIKKVGQEKVVKYISFTDPENNNYRISVNLWDKVSLLVDDTLEKGDILIIKKAYADNFKIDKAGKYKGGNNSVFDPTLKDSFQMAKFLHRHHENYPIIQCINAEITVEYRRKRILVDGSNMAYMVKDNDGKPTLEGIEKIVKELENKGYYPIIIIDASLRYKISDADKDMLEKYIQGYKLQQVPSKVMADELLLNIAYRKDLKIVSNDRFKDFIKEYQKYLFCWDDVPENNTEFIKFLRSYLKIEWTESAEIKKSENGESITIINKENSITLKLDKVEKKATLEIVNGISKQLLKSPNDNEVISNSFEIQERSECKNYEYNLEEKGGKLNIYYADIENKIISCIVVKGINEIIFTHKGKIWNN